ncbi:hypothetical protein KR084_006235 [Drosophila pseudotakahashii]|nr:hypothetical protein KR084_006235 [Drosophila pseudotakahashii]
MVILAGVGRATGRSGGQSDSSVPWSRRHYSSERRDEKDWRDMPPSEPRYLSDPEILFQRLDDMEQIGSKSVGTDRLSSLGKEKSENFLVGSKNIGAQLFKEELSKFPTSGQEMGQDYSLTKKMEDPFESLARMNFNEQPLEHKTDRELKRMLGYYRRKDRDEQPAVATANLLAKVISSKVDQPRVALKGQTCRATTARPLSTMRSTTTTTRRTTTSTTSRSPSTFCLPEPEPSADRLIKPMPSTPPPSTRPVPPPPTRKPCGNRVRPSKCRMKSKSKKPGGTKKLLDIILSTKQHALSVLKCLNHLEMELLSRSAEDEGSDKRSKEPEVPKKTCERLEKPLKANSRVFSFGIRPASQKESMYDLALAKEEELKLEDRVWEEHQQQMKLRRPIKPKRFEAAPAAAARLEPFQEPRKPHESLDPLDSVDSVKQKTPADDRRINLEALSVVVKPMSPPLPKKDSSDPSAHWNPSLLPRAEMKAIRVEGPIDDELQPSKILQKRRRKKKKHKLYAQEQQTEANRLPIAGVFY